MNLTVIKKSLHVWKKTLNQTNIYLFKVNNRNTRKRYEICSKLTIKTPERRHWRSSCVYIVNFEHISHLYLVFLLLLWTSKCKLGNNYKWHFTGAAVRRCSTKLLMFSNVFWKISLENSCARYNVNVLHKFQEDLCFRTLLAECFWRYILFDIIKTNK